MSLRVHKKTNPRQVVRFQIKKRIKRKLTAHQSSHPRMVPFRSNQFLYCQLIDPKTGHTLAQANTREDEFKSLKSRKDVAAGMELGKVFAARVKAKNLEAVVFDRNGYAYHGRIKAIAEGAREAGLKF